ncbi:MAG: hypothetical protein JWM93_1579, partial [Frankiales bacterium]|nr:hypothetical protein [Frankiales bacterium]
VDWVRANVTDPLLIAPSTQTGLTPGHLRDIAEFCESHARP